MVKTNVLLAAVAACGVSGLASGAVVFSEDFDSRTSGAVTAAGDLGTGFAFTGTPYGVISGGADKAYTTAQSGQNVFTEGGSFPNTFSADPETDAANLLTASFSAVEVNTANTTTVNFDIGSFGTQNSGQFKALVVRGLDSSSGEVFETWIGVGGSGGGTRFFYNRGLGDTQYTLTASNAGTPSGTLFWNGLTGMNSTNSAAKPGAMKTVTMTIANGQITYNVNSGTAQGSVTFALNAATDLAGLEFTSFQNNGGGGNAGYWLDNISVDGTVVPEPGSLALLGLGGLMMVKRRRRA